MNIESNYMRINHFDDYLTPYIIQDNCPSISAKMIEDIKREMSKQMIVVKLHNHTIIRKMLVNCGYKDYEKYIPYIVSKLNGTKLIGISKKTAEQLKTMFQRVSYSFDKYRNQQSCRKSFLNYGYILYKLIELIRVIGVIGVIGELSFLSIPKSREKLIAYDKVWKTICIDIGWIYIPTV